MNIKKIGTEFEQELCKALASCGYWVHFLTPNAAGQQPFDIVAVRNGEALVIDCKTCVQNSISFSRLEYNQRFAFELWLKRGNSQPIVAVKHNNTIYWVGFTELKRVGRIKLEPGRIWEELNNEYQRISECK